MEILDDHSVVQYDSCREEGGCQSVDIEMVDVEDKILVCSSAEFPQEPGVSHVKDPHSVIPSPQPHLFVLLSSDK
jgi:hypothetical protein